MKTFSHLFAGRPDPETASQTIITEGHNERWDLVSLSILPGPEINPAINFQVVIASRDERRAQFWGIGTTPILAVQNARIAAQGSG